MEFLQRHEPAYSTLGRKRFQGREPPWRRIGKAIYAEGDIVSVQVADPGPARWLPSTKHSVPQRRNTYAFTRGVIAQSKIHIDAQGRDGDATNESMMGSYGQSYPMHCLEDRMMEGGRLLAENLKYCNMWIP